MTTPEQGDFLQMDVSPQAGSEPPEERYGLVLSLKAYNKKTGYAIVAPIVAQATGYPFEAAIPPGLRCRGVALVDQARRVDWRARGLRVKGKAPDSMMEDVFARLLPILGQ